MNIIVLKVDDIMLLICIGLSSPSVFLDASFAKFGLEEFKVFFFNWVDGGHNVPVHVFCAWRSGDGSSVDPSIIGVDQGEKIRVEDPVDDWIFLIQSEVIEEVVDDFLLGPSQFGVVLFGVENDADGSCDVTISWIRLGWEVNSVHAEIEKLAIDGMLRSVMEMELNTVVMSWSAVDLLGDVGGEHHWTGNSALEINLGGECVFIPLGSSLIGVLVEFRELID